MPRGLALAWAALALLLRPATGSIYSVDFEVPRGTYKNFTEGPIFGAADAPHWFGVPRDLPVVRLQGRFVHVNQQGRPLKGAAQNAAVPAGTTVSVVLSQFEQRVAADAADGAFFSGCTPEVGKGGVVHAVSLDLVNGWAEVDERTELLSEVPGGWTYVTVSACDGGRLADGLDMAFKGLITIKNPYGYLPALLFGYLAFFGGMFLFYAALATVFGLRCFCMRRHLLRLQLMILGVMVMGVLETAAWFFTYHEMNTKGEPLCCPVRADITFSIIITIFKKTVSQLLLLAVSLGYGVVKPELPRKTTALVLALGAAYLASSLNYYIRRVVATSNGDADSSADAGWNLPVAVCDVAFIFWIYLSLSQVQKSLLASGQHIKLGMYQRLARTLGFFVLLWVLYSVISIAVNYGAITLSWKHAYILDGFWDVLYFLLLVAISVIWAPSKRAESYAYSSQIPQDDFDEEDGEGGVEMAHVETAEVFHSIGGDDSDDDSGAEEVEVDLGVSRRDSEDGTIANV